MRPEADVKRELCRRVLNELLDVLILSKLEDSESMCGYDFLGFIREKFGIFLNPGTLYPSLYAMEREGFISGYSSQRRRVYKLTDRGKEFVDSARQAVNAVQNLIGEIMKVKSPR